MEENKDLIINGEEVIPSIETTHIEPMSQALLRFSRYLEILTHYHAVKDADLESLADLITRAKGPYRSMRQFAEDVGVSPATMSRIMNQKTAGPLNNELLAKIAANADKQSGVTLEMLLAANGEAKKGTATREQLYEEAARKALLDGLVERGYSVASSTEALSTKRSGPGFVMRFDFAIETDAVGGKDGNPGKWLFEFKTGMSSIVDATHARTGTGRYRQWLTMVMSLYYCGVADADRISYLTDRRDMYNQLKESLEGISIPNEISVILIHNGRVIEEFIAPTTERQPKEVFYEIDRSSEEVNPMDAVEEMDWDMDAFSGRDSSVDSSAGQQAGGADGN